MRLRTKTVAALAAGVVALTTLAACASTPSASDAGSAAPASDTGSFAVDKNTLVFATVPDKAGSDSAWQPLEQYIEKKTGLHVEFKPTTDYAALIAAGIAGQVDVGAFSGATYTLAEKKGAKFDLVSAVGVEAGASEPGYYSEAIVPKSSGISKVSDFKGKTICFVSPESTSGFFFPLQTLKKAGISVQSTGNDANGNPQFKDFTAYFAGAHDKSVAAVESGQCQVGFAEDAEADAAADLKVVDKELVPGGPLVISSTLPKAVKDKLVAALKDVTLDDITSSGAEVSDAFSANFQFAKEVKPDFYDQIKDICATIPAAGCAG